MNNLNVNIESLKKYKHVHMIGIGGISMSGIAEILHEWGIPITGSDSTRSRITDRLSSHGIFVSIGHDTNLVKEADLVIYSAAIKENDPELIEARKNKITTIGRADFIGYLTRIYKDTICVSGTHGKTTTTSMVSLCFLNAGFDPTIQVGAFIKQINENNRIGNSEYFILESCEYFESFLKFSPKSIIALNIDNDHLDYFKNFDNIKKAFEKFVSLLPYDGLLVVNADDPNCLALRSHTEAKSVTFAINNDKANFTAKNISFDDNGYAKFDVYHNNTYFIGIKLSIPGIHNVLNALACIALCSEYGIDKYEIKTTLLEFIGSTRRFEFVGSYKGMNIYDDYAHHPTEILAIADTLKNKKYRQSWIVFQPHTYSRTKTHLDEFAKSLTNFDNIIVTDIYAAREINTYNISSKDLVNKIKSLGKNAFYISSFDEIAKFIRKSACEKDIVLTVGAGTITELGKKIIKNDSQNFKF